MSEPVARERTTVDLDDFERRLRQHDQRREDPLAELARLVGENHDPYRDVFAQEAMARVSQGAPAYQPQSYEQPSQSYDPPGHREPSFEAPVGMSPRLSGDFAAIEAGLRGALSAHPEAYPHGDAGGAEHEFYAQQDQYSQHDQAYLQDHEDQQWAEAAPQQAMQPPPPRSRRPIYAMVVTIAVGVIGVGVAFAYKGVSSSPREIRTIAAASGPTKIQPPADASSDQGNQDPAILGKSGQQSPTRLVSGEEQPVDISQAVQENGSRNADVGSGQGDASSVPVPPSPSQASNGSPDTPSIPPDAVLPADQIPGFGMTDMPPPKKVKVVSVRPDGTILSNDARQAAAPSDSAPSDGPSASDSPAPLASPTTPETGTPKTGASKMRASKTGTPKTTSRVATKPVPVVSADPDGDTPAPKPLHKAKPKTKPKPVDVASAEPTPDDSQPTTASIAPKGSGGFAVQLAAPGSESDARSVSSRLAKKFASALDGRRLGFHKAQSNGKSVFRVRVGSLSREDATSLCEKLKADGGSCFVAKNN